MTSAEYRMLEARVAANALDRTLAALPGGEPVELEKGLHFEIMKYCDAPERRWYYVHSRMDKRSTTRLGTPDFVIALPTGRTLWIEAKARREKPSEEQLCTLAVLRKLGHEAVVVYNMADFLKVVDVAKE